MSNTRSRVNRHNETRANAGIARPAHRSQGGMVSCGSGVIVCVQRFLDKDEVVPALPKEGDAYMGRVGPEAEGDTLHLTLLKGMEVAK